MYSLTEQAQNRSLEEQWPLLYSACLRLRMHLTILQWAIVIGLALVPIVVVEIEKLLFRMIRALFPPKEKSHKKVNKKEAKQL